MANLSSDTMNWQPELVDVPTEDYSLVVTPTAGRGFNILTTTVFSAGGVTIRMTVTVGGAPLPPRSQLGTAVFAAATSMYVQTSGIPVHVNGQPGPRYIKTPGTITFTSLNQVNAGATVTCDIICSTTTSIVKGAMLQEVFQGIAAAGRVGDGLH